MVGEFGVGGLEPGQYSRHGHGGRSLDVIVEGAVLVAVLLQEAEGVVVAKVLELNQGVLKKPKMKDEKKSWYGFETAPKCRRRVCSFDP